MPAFRHFKSVAILNTRPEQIAQITRTASLIKLAEEI